MATFLMIHCNRHVYGVQYLSISVMASIAKKAGHRFELFDVANYEASIRDTKIQNNHDIKEGGIVPLSVKPLVSSSTLPRQKPLKYLFTDLKNTIKLIEPDCIGFSCFSENWAFTLLLIRYVYKKFSIIPIVVGGVHATLVPEDVLKHPEVSAVCIGEGDQSLLELLNSIDCGRIDKTVRNFYFKSRDCIIKNKKREPIERFKDPILIDWELFSDIHFVYPYEGRLYRRGSVILSLGCLYHCSYCINNFYKKNLPRHGVRAKDVDLAVDEIVYLKAKYDLSFLRFWDENFLALPDKYLKRFSERYRREVTLPFTIETSANTITADKLKWLADMGCLSISVGVETINEEYRKKILKKNVSNIEYEKAFRLISEYNIRKVANFMFFLPYSTIEEMYQTIIYCAKWKIESPSPRVFYPYLGTELRDFCFRENLVNKKMVEVIENEEEVSSLEDLTDKDLTCMPSVLNFPEKVKQEGMLLLRDFVLMQETPEWMHEWLIGLGKKGDTVSSSILGNIRDLLEKNKYDS